jgi:CRISPR type III-A-associated RAMP protein Csm4
LLFHESQTFYARGHAGLWFLACADSEAWKWLEAAFRYLADTGLGGKRTVGKGHFDFVAEPVSGLLPEIADPDSFVTLSCYLPPAAAESDQMEVAPRSYTLVTVYQKAENKFPGTEQMRVYSGRVCLFGEGSIFALEGERRPWYGRLAPLGQVDERTVYYNGLALPAFARLGGVT